MDRHRIIYNFKYKNEQLAIIGARLVVTNGFTAYAIVARNPATIIKYRFPNLLLKN
jgi:acetyltransferase-like isoleucine patch superfamily enzyme